MPLAVLNSEADIAVVADETESSEETAIGEIEQPITNPEPDRLAAEATDPPQIDVPLLRPMRLRKKRPMSLNPKQKPTPRMQRSPNRY